MLDSASVITTATQGIVEDLRKEYEVSTRRMYEILGKDCVYPKTKKLIRRIARHNQPGARLIKADIESMFLDILEEAEEPSLEDIHKEAFEAVDSILRNKPRAEQKTQLLELVTICQAKLEGIERNISKLKSVGRTA
jgi:hypothetical protein